MVEIAKIISVVLRVPMHLFLWGTFAASIYAAVKKIQNISWGTPVLFGIIILCWYVGVWLTRQYHED